MNLTCHQCGHHIEFQETRPKYCGQCGHRLETEVASFEAETIAPARPAAPAPPAAQLTEIDRYDLIDRIGSGGMGVVYEAKEKDTGRRVAVKVLSAGLSNDETNVERFVREGRLAAQLSHSRTTFIYEAGEDNGRPYIAMELMPGTTLQDELDRNGPMETTVAVDYILDVIDGLIAAHKLDVIHRDVKPSNCFVDTDGRIKVGDFGLSKNLVTDVNLTRTGAFMGTPSFAAPEQIRGGEIDLRTDVYAVGATLFMLIANRPPFIGDALSVTAQIVQDKPESLKKIVKEVPKDLAKIVDTALAKNPADRFGDLQTMRRALQPFASKGTTLAAIGRRIGAYMLDMIMLNLFLQLGMGFFGAVSGATMQMTGQVDKMGEQILEFSSISVVWLWFSAIIYFTVTEGLWGRSVGKAILGLRVVDADGERPNILRTFLRSLIIPGLFGITLLANVVRSLLVDLGMINPVSIDGIFLISTVDKFFQWVLPFLVCVTTMRERNGFRGVHGYASGTRVIRVERSRDLEPLKALPDLQIIQDDSELPVKIGPYGIDGVIARSVGLTVFSGIDETLDRPVWIFCRPEKTDQAFYEVMSTNRATRCRWLQGGHSELGYWDAFENIDGVPYIVFAQQKDLFDWENSRQAILDYSTELAESVQDGSLPKNLDISQFWVERNGHGKISEFGLTPESSKSGSDSHDAYVRFEEILNLTEKGQSTSMPASVNQLIHNYVEKKKEPETLGWFASRLKNEMGRLPSLKWDSRLGVLAITLGGEWVLYSAMLSLASWLFLAAVGTSMSSWHILPMLIVPSLVFFAIGFALRGAPVFKFMGIDVHHRKGGLASPFRCGIRNVICWLPLCYLMAIFIPAFAVAVNQANVQAEQGGQDTANVPIDSGQVMFADEPFIFIASMAIAVFLLAVLAASAIIAIANPQRGVQDYLAGTRLVPR